MMARKPTQSPSSSIDLYSAQTFRLTQASRSCFLIGCGFFISTCVSGLRKIILDEKNDDQTKRFLGV